MSCRHRHSNLRLVALVLASLVGLLLCACAVFHGPQMDPFARATFLFFDSAKSGRGISDALIWLDLEAMNPKSVTVRIFDEHDRPLSFDPKPLTWSGSENLKIEPAAGTATVKVTLLGSGAGRLQVTIGNHTGEIRVRKAGG